MRKHTFLQLKELIPKSLTELGIKQKLQEQQIINAWQNVFGETISKYTKNTFIKNGTLYIKITSPVLKNDLMLQKQLLIDKLNKSTDSNIVKDIRFL